MYLVNFTLKCARSAKREGVWVSYATDAIAPLNKIE